MPEGGRLLLINPTMAENERTRHHAGGFASLEPLALGYLAALTPRHWEVQIVDEVTEPIPVDYEPDLVGLTSMTLTAPRAYEIAQRYREKGATVIMGGTHATLLPDEAARYVDVVFQGEADQAWPSVIRDFEAGTLQPRYNGRAAELDNSPMPRRDLYRRPYFVQSVSASRGCLYRCEYCTLWQHEGGRYRSRNPEQVLDELEATHDQSFLHSFSKWAVFFTDENMYIDREWSLALFQGMVNRGLRRRYAIQASINMADDTELLATLKRSGCTQVLIGFESISEESLRTMRKGVNLKAGVAHYKEKIDRLHDHGLVAHGTFMFGNDGDGLDIFERTAEFVLEASLDMAYFGIVTPYPGTPMYRRLAETGRLLYTDFPSDYRRYDTKTAVFRPLDMTPEELEQGLVRAVRMVGSRAVAARRAWRTWKTVKDPILTALVYNWNRSGLYSRVVD